MLVGISKANSRAATENKGQTRGALYQRKYKKKAAETNTIKAEFIQYAKNHARSLYKDSLREKR